MWLHLPLLIAIRYMELLGEVCKGLPSLASVVNPTESQVIQALFATAAEASILTLQNRIEAMCYNLGKQATKRDATAGARAGDTGTCCSICLPSAWSTALVQVHPRLESRHCCWYSCQQHHVHVRVLAHMLAASQGSACQCSSFICGGVLSCRAEPLLLYCSPPQGAEAPQQKMLAAHQPTGQPGAAVQHVAAVWQCAP